MRDEGRFDQDPRRIRSMFARITPHYDGLNRLFSASLDRRWRRRTAAVLTTGLSPCQRILDVATGTGDLAAAVRRHSGASVVGLDFTRPMLTRGRHKLGSRGFDWVEGDGLALPFADSSFDGLCIAFGLRNFADRARGLGEMARVVRPGGRVAILEFSQPRNPLIRRLYDLYSFTVMPRVGRWLSGTDAYLYLPTSIRSFPTADELASDMTAAGFVDARYLAFTLGVVCVHLGEVGEAAVGSGMSAARARRTDGRHSGD